MASGAVNLLKVVQVVQLEVEVVMDQGLMLLGVTVFQLMGKQEMWSVNIVRKY